LLLKSDFIPEPLLFQAQPSTVKPDNKGDQTRQDAKESSEAVPLSEAPEILNREEADGSVSTETQQGSEASTSTEAGRTTPGYTGCTGCFHDRPMEELVCLEAAADSSASQVRKQPMTSAEEGGDCVSSCNGGQWAPQPPRVNHVLEPEVGQKPVEEKKND
jgi:hypothetical protein